MLLLFSSCEKKILEILPVIEVEKDMSIAGAKDIKYFSFPSDAVGYAASDTGFIYKTSNGGNSWEIIPIEDNRKCRGLEFFDESIGMCLMGNYLYVTDDGGQTWNYRGNVDFIGKTKDGIGVTGDCGFFSCDVRISSDSLQSFQSIGSVTMEGGLTASRVVDNKVIVITNDTYYDDRAYGLDLTTGEDFAIGFDNLIYSENPNDIYLSGENGTVVGPNGLIMRTSYFGFSRAYYGNTNTYYSVDGYEDFMVCVGERTIATNMDIGNDERWNEVFDDNGNGFRSTFYKIRFIDQSTFYVSGSSGLIFKAKI
jgi:hypothetical protein